MMEREESQERRQPESAADRGKQLREEIDRLKGQQVTQKIACGRRFRRRQCVSAQIHGRMKT